MRIRPILILLAALVPLGAALAADATTAADPTGAVFPAIASASPPVAIALALAYGAYTVGKTVAAVSALAERLLERGIPIRVELSEADREALAGARDTRPRAVAGGGR